MLHGKGVRSRGDHGLGGYRWEGGGCISCRRGWGEKRALKGRQRKIGRATQQADTGAGSRQAKGVLREKETKEKRNKNSPLIFQRRKGEGRLGASVLRWGSRSRPPRLSATNVLSRNRRDGYSLLQ